MSMDNLENLSDEDFLNQTMAVQEGTSDEGADTGSELPEVPQEAEAGGSSTQADTAENSGESEAEPAPAADPDTPDSSPADAGDDKADDENSSSGSQAGSADDSHHTTPDQTEASKDEGADKPTETGGEAVNYEDAYKRIMAPFKANGRDFQPQSPEEVVRLMQMGANYTKKMQSLAPNLKKMRMLENHGLLDEQKLSFLIDLDRKDPAAIAKLLKDANIDPLDLDTSSAPDYRPGNHAVSDQEHAFRSVLDDMMSTPTGQETVALVNKQWDQASKEALYAEPEILNIIDQQRANGIYDQISAEIDRQKMLGTLPQTTPFLQAYKAVGDQLHAAGKLAPPQAANPSVSQQPLETRVAAPKAPASNGDKAKAASPARSAPKAPPKEFNPLAMSDEEILAATQTRF